MSLFQNRTDAGRQLSYSLQAYKQARDTIIIGLPRGGVPLAYEVALELNLPLDIIVVRKIGAPFQKELAIGAVTETGEVMINEERVNEFGISQSYIEKEVKEQENEARRRVNLYRGFTLDLDAFRQKTVIIVDDGVATGETIRAAIKTVKNLNAKIIIAATPVIAPDVRNLITPYVDELVYIEAPTPFGAVGAFYDEFPQTTDEEVISCLEKASLRV